MLSNLAYNYGYNSIEDFMITILNEEISEKWII